ncbi:uncharacterized protein LOC126708625 isoform X1 [Quercus robur]|uniref:uncharacterized protein LOC126708625 isoform X1 n=1 Tax=Quercus robur TaxID=38942 RepID=UPI0021615A3D|nr:uncharacterized protein LOC126708625 isoform X1 [Quercus robur]
MQGDEARTLLGFPPNSHPTLSQVKAAYKRKVWESHPDLFPAQQKPHAESKFKLISEAYSCLLSEVLQKMESDESQSMSFIYDDMHGAKLAIKAIHGEDAQKYEPFWSVTDNHWNSLFLHPLWYRPDFTMYPEVILGLNECIVRQESDNGKRIAASMQIPDCVSSKADFGMDLAISTRTELDPIDMLVVVSISTSESVTIIAQLLVFGSTREIALLVNEVQED